MTEATTSTPELKKALNQRQLRMIAIGGVIGAGLFVGSGVVMADTGPGVFMTYALSGVLIIMVMRMLAEMAVAHPSTGSFADYSRDALGHWAGFSVGWLYWYFWVIVVGFEAIAGAKIVQYWIGVPLWLCALVFMVLMTATNLFSVKSYGEFEFWFAGIKVAAIVAFIVVGACFVFGLWPGKSADFSNLWSHGGFMPMGAGVITVGIVTVIFSMVGPEIATIAAAESADPEKAVAKAANSVIMRILVFYVLSVFLLVTIVPWNDKGLAGSPFVAAFTKMGIPYADHIMNAVVLTAVLSCLNSGMYTASRMLFVLAARNEAPTLLVRVTRRGVPANAILFSSVVGFLCVIAAAFAEDTIFAFLLNSSGAIILFVYILIAISQIVLRYRDRDAELRLKMWLFPALSILTTVAMLAILVQMYLDDKLRSQLLLSLLSWAVVVGLYFANRRFIDRREAAQPQPHRLPGAGAEQQTQQVGDGGGAITDQQLSQRPAHRGSS
jgi:GABA permease